MTLDNIKISRINNEVSSKQEDDAYAVCWVKNEVEGIEIDGILYKNVSNAIFFLNPVFDWKIIKRDDATSSGYVVFLPQKTLDHPIFKNLHINEIRLFNTGEIPKINLTPGIEIRVQAILEMLDELLSTNLKHREEAILSLLNTFFVYCDGKCNIRSAISHNNSKSSLVYKLKKTIDQHIAEYHEVGDYARLLNVSDKYLNECVKNVLGVNTKNLIDEQLTMRARYQLKFTDDSIKEISYSLGFSSPDYFSFFFKKQTGNTPTQVRKV
jgi:AraC-like DNA-binding protein